MSKGFGKTDTKFDSFCKELVGCRCTGYRVAEQVCGEELPPEVLGRGAAMMEAVKQVFVDRGFEVVSLDEFLGEADD